jgi:hypothetical protein
MVIGKHADYIVRFFKGNDMRKMVVVAHDEDEAVELAKMQSKYSKMGGGKFELISVFKDGQPDPYEIALDKVRF